MPVKAIKIKNYHAKKGAVIGKMCVRVYIKVSVHAVFTSMYVVSVSSVIASGTIFLFY